MHKLNFTIKCSDGSSIDCKVAEVDNNLKKYVDVDLIGGNVVLFLTHWQIDMYSGPRSRSWDDIKHFCDQNANDYQRILKSPPASQAFTPGNTIRLFGRDYKLEANDLRKTAIMGYDYISAPTKNFAKKVEAEIKASVKSKLHSLCDSYAPVLTDILDNEWKVCEAANPYVRRYHRMHNRSGEVTYDDLQFLRAGTNSLWGDCSVGGRHRRRVRFDWRIASGKRESLEYIAAHEMAHLLEMNHDPKFYNVVSELLGRDGRQADFEFDQDASGRYDDLGRTWYRFGTPNKFFRNVRVETANYI